MYFNEFSNDQIVPRKGDDDLVEKYSSLIKEEEGYDVDMFDTELEMWQFAAEQAHYARDGVSDFEEYSREEMEELISDVN